MKGIDYTQQTTHAMVNAMKAAGIEYVGRYVVPERASYLDKSLSWKRFTASEAKILTDAERYILSIFETTADSPKHGADRGTLDGRYAYGEMRHICQPEGSTIYFCCDWDAQPEEYPVILEYLKAAQKEISGYHAGCYGKYALMEYLSAHGINYLWQTIAWSYGKLSKYANIHQLKQESISGIGTADRNESFGGEGFWNLKSMMNNDKEVIIVTEWEKNAMDFVTKFQKAFGLDNDGKAGAVTNAKLDEIIKDTDKLNQIRKVLG